MSTNTTTTIPSSKPIVDYSLYYVTGRELIPTGIDFFENLNLACQGGIGLVQLREKDVSTREFLDIGIKCKEICDKYSIPLLINDRLDIALALNCGLHIGQSDLPPLIARKLLGPHQILGLSINTPEELIECLNLNKVQGDGFIDYVGLGPVYDTNSKKNVAPRLGTRGVRELLSLMGDSEMKCVAIGGINHSTLSNVLLQTPTYIPSSSPTIINYKTLNGVAVISAIASSLTPLESTKSLKLILNSIPTFPLKDNFGPTGLGFKEGNDMSGENMLVQIAELLSRLREAGSPVVHHITNNVVMNDTANLTLSLSCSPIMSASPEEAPTLSLLSSSLLLNLGTLNPLQTTCQLLAGKSANLNSKMVIFDPVGCGATNFRMNTAKKLMSEISLGVIKGNAGEIGALVGSEEVKSRGVDSVGDGFREPGKVVRELSRREKVVIAMSGKIDNISNGIQIYSLSNGNEFQGLITGSGCMTTSSIACFATLKNVSPLLAALAGITAINVAAEIAAERLDVKGPNTFRSALIDECWNLKPEDILKRGKILLI